MKKKLAGLIWKEPPVPVIWHDIYLTIELYRDCFIRICKFNKCAFRNKGMSLL